jgi:hypothetical protein
MRDATSSIRPGGVNAGADRRRWRPARKTNTDIVGPAMIQVSEKAKPVETWAIVAGQGAAVPASK